MEDGTLNCEQETEELHCDDHASQFDELSPNLQGVDRLASRRKYNLFILRNPDRTLQWWRYNGQISTDSDSAQQTEY